MLCRLGNCCALGLCIGLLGGNAAAVEWTGDAALTSDYVFRGLSQTGGDPAIQAGATATFASGWYVSGWGSTVDYGADIGANSEFDAVIGWSGAVSESLVLDLSLVQYLYPASRADLDYAELIARLALDERFGISVGWSPDVFNSGATGTWFGLDGSWPFAGHWSLDAAVGHYTLGAVAGDDYSHASLGLARRFGPASLRATRHSTNRAIERSLGDDVAGDRIELALELSF